MAPHALHSVNEALAWLQQHGASRLCTDSRRVQPGSAFIAWPGYAVDGRQFVAAASSAGAAACLVEAQGAEAWVFDGASPVATLNNLKAATGELAAAFEGWPSQVLDVVATTGTNGKTSTAWWTAQALTALGQRAGLIGTLGVGEPPWVGASPAGHVHQPLLSNGLTTPDPVTLQSALGQFVQQGMSACVLEASSIGIVEQRLSGCAIDVALFTNFTQDHLDYHGGMEAYWQAKAALFRWPGLRAAVVNVDDAKGAELAAELSGGDLDLWTYSQSAAVATESRFNAGFPARLQAQQVRSTATGGLAFTVHEGHEQAVVHTTLIGDYNVSNLLAVVGALRALGLSLADAAAVCALLTPVPGRMQRVASPAPEAPQGLPEVVVDYAHTPDALDKTLRALRSWADERHGQLWCVFGCGGNRDAVKRPLMGAVAEQGAQQLVLTSDNPRDESPALILAQMAAGLSANTKAVKIEDRALAIAHAVSHAASQDVILLAGKGHEETQEIQGRKLPFSDVAQAQDALRQRAAVQAVRA